tara:strand:- start:43778 stop:45469 length:1692 start_codon:yes stop_codon:yes gene_type:complete
MAINYSSVTYITNGQAITANNLNAPSVDLATRTVEVQRNSLYEDFLENYSNSVEVQLLPLISSAQDASYITITSHLEDLGSGNFLKSYSFTLTDAVLSVYSDKFPGSRYIVQDANIASHFSSFPMSPPSGTYANSVQLHVPGDGLYLKRPTKYTSSVTDSGSHAESVLPNTEASSSGRTYVDANQNLGSSIVKLPLRNKVTLASSGYSTAAAFLSAVNTATWNSGSAIANLSATVNSSNVLSITDGSDTYTLYITGLQNAKAQVSKVYIENTHLVLEVSETTAPIYHQIANAACTNIGLKLYAANGMTAYTNTSIINQSSAQYSVGLVDLDSSHMYIPLARLTETSLIVGNREFSLLRNYISNNSDYSSSQELFDLHGAPIEYLDTSLSSAASKSYKVDLRSELPIPKGKVTLGKRSTIVGGVLKCDFSRDAELLRLLEFSQGLALNILEIRIVVLTAITTASSASGFRVQNLLKARNSSNSTLNHLFMADSGVDYVAIPGDSLGTVLNELSLSSTGGTLSSTLANTIATRNTECYVNIFEDSGSGSNAITGGEVYVELDLLV